MTFEIRVNGKVSLLLSPSTELEKLALAEMVSAASKGRTVILAPEEDGLGTVSLRVKE